MRPGSDRPAPDGLLVVDKPPGWTSHDVVARIRRLARTRKVGHAGTLDPAATGVLVLGIGRATRLLGQLALTEKDYRATIRLGATTVTDDAEGDVLERCDAGAVTDGALAAVLAGLTGPQLQVPSSVSAVKVAGVRSYARVRAGEQVALAPRPVLISRVDRLARRGDDVDVEVTCSSGTYIRALARDVGVRLGVGAHLVALRRTRVGPFTCADALSLDDLGSDPAGSAGPVDAAVIGLDVAVRACFPHRELTAAEALDLSHGRAAGPTGSPGLVAGFGPDGRCVALLRDEDARSRPVVVFTPAGGGHEG